MEKEENEHNVLRDVLSEEELTQIPQGLATKLNTYFNEKFEQYITAKAVFETNRKNFGTFGSDLTLFVRITIDRFIYMEELTSL